MKIVDRILLYGKFEERCGEEGVTVLTTFLGMTYEHKIDSAEVEGVGGDIQAWNEVIARAKKEIAIKVASDILEFIIPEKGEFLRFNEEGILMYNQFTNEQKTYEETVLA